MFNILKNKTNFSLLIVFVIPLLILGPFFPDLIVSFSSIIFLIYVIKKKNFRFFNNKPFIIFSFFCVYCILVSIFVSDEMLFSLKSSMTYIRIGVFACVIWYLIEKDINILNYFYFILIITFSILVADSYIQYFFGHNSLGWAPRDHGRVSSFFGDELVMGSYLSRLLPLLCALFLIRKKNKIEILYFFTIIILSCGSIIIAGERTALFFLILSFFFILILLHYKKLLLFILFLISVLFTFFIFNNTELKSRLIIDPIKSMGFMDYKKKNYIFTYSHDSLIKTAFNMFLDKPIIGHGPKMFRVICKDEKYATGLTPCMTHPHNFYVQLLAETGIVGFMFLLSALVHVIYCAVRQLKTILFKERCYLSDYQVCLMACLLITVWPLSPNGNFFNNWLAICYSLPVGFYLHSIYGKNRDKILKE